MTSNGADRLKVYELTKKYKDLVAVDKVSFEAYRGHPMAILGRNGAGKSTMLLEAVVVIVIECRLLQNRGVIHMEKVSCFIKMMGIGTSEILVIVAMSFVAIFIYLLLYAMVGVGITNQQQI